MTKYQSGLLIATVLGLVSLVIGAFDLAATFGYQMDFKEVGFGSVSKGPFGKTGLILCELMITLAFSVAGALFAGVGKQIRDLKGILILLGISRLFLLCLILGMYWKQGWHYILDPAGNHGAVYLILFLSVLQGFAFFLPLFQKAKPTV